MYLGSFPFPNYSLAGKSVNNHNYFLINVKGAKRFPVEANRMHLQQGEASFLYLPALEQVHKPDKKCIDFLFPKMYNTKCCIIIL